MTSRMKSATMCRDHNGRHHSNSGRHHTGLPLDVGLVVDDGDDCDGGDDDGDGC